MTQQLAKQILTLPSEVAVHLQESTCDARTRSGALVPWRRRDQTPDNFDNYHAADRAVRRIDQQSRGFSFRIPLRFRQQIWHVAAVHSISGWMFGWHTYTLRPRQAPVFALLKDGDVLGMRKLFASGQGSPYDCNEYGETLLEVPNSL